ECIIFSILSPSFLTIDNFVNVALQIAIYGILAVGMTLVIITGGIDLSVGSLVALSAVAAAAVMEKLGGQPGLSILLAVALGIGLGLVAGAFSGLMVSRLRVHPFIAALALATFGAVLPFVSPERLLLWNVASRFAL